MSRKSGAGKKILIGGISLVLLVAVVIGVVVGVAKSNRKVGDDFSLPADGNVATSSKAIAAFCSPTDYKDVCVRSLTSALSGNTTAGPKQIAEAAVKVTLDEVRSAFNRSEEIGKGTTDKMQLAALSDCRVLLQDAVDELQDALSDIDSNDLHDLPKRAGELKNWLSAVISYQQTCLDGLTHPEIKTQMHNGLLNATELTSNALAIITQLASVFESFQLPQNMPAESGGDRRLLDQNDDEPDPPIVVGSFPEWFSVSDRRLLDQNDDEPDPPIVVGSFPERFSVSDRRLLDQNDDEPDPPIVVGSFPERFSVSDRRLLDQNDDEPDPPIVVGSFPEWFSVSDRRLLAAQKRRTVKPNVVVAKDGSGNFKTINDALNAMPAKYSGRYVIYVKAGVYEENVLVTKKMINVFMYGDGPKRSIVSGRKNFVDGTPTFQTATFAAIGNGFIAKSMGFRNTAGPEKHQAVALRVQSDMSAFFNCRMDGYQDTLYAQTHRQFYRNCVVSGTIDFIFGDSAVVLQNCLIIVRRPLDNQQNSVTAHGRSDKRETTGLVIHNCRIVPDRKLFPDRFKIPSYLGRPWKEYSRTVVMESTIGDLIRPEGWMAWNGDFALRTLYYAEYANRGPGARTNRRVRWPGYKVITTRKEALQFTVASFIQGNLWLRFTGAPYILGLNQ